MRPPQGFFPHKPSAGSLRHPNYRRSAQTLAAALRGQAVSFRPRILGFVLRRKQTRMNHQWCVGGLEALQDLSMMKYAVPPVTSLIPDPKMGFLAAVYNAKNEMEIRHVHLVGFFALALAGCMSGDVSLPTIVPLPTNTSVIALNPSATPRPTDTLAPTPTLTPTLTPTPAPVTYTVTEKDDMFGVALRYGISLDALKAANPTVIPNLMSVGTVLIIPITPTPVSPGTSQETPTQTPDPFSPLRLAMAPVCYRDALGGAYCFVQLENLSQSPVENPSVRFTLTDADATRLEMDGILPLNILPAQQTIPAVAYFPAPIPESFEISAQILDWLPVMPDDTRYLEAEIAPEPPVIAYGGGFAEAAGVVTIPEDEADYVWVLGVVYDSNGQVLGLRRWEAEVPLSTSGSMPFSFRIYAMQGEIAEMKLFVEAHATIP